MLLTYLIRESRSALRRPFATAAASTVWTSAAIFVGYATPGFLFARVS